MQATLTFKLPEEQVEHRQAVDAGLYASLVGDLADYFRQRLKHVKLTAPARRELQAAQAQLWDGARDRNLDVS